MPVFSAFVRALRDVGRARVLAVLFLPMLGAIVLWTVLAWVFWGAWTEAFRSFIEGTWIARWLVEHGASWVLGSVSVVFVFALVLPAMLITAMLITELVAMPVIVSVVGYSYPGLAKQSGGTVLGSLVNAAAAVGIFTLLWVGTLPLWLTGWGAAVLPAVSSAYLIQRLLRYDALSEHASRAEYDKVVSHAKGRLYLLGLLVSLLYYVPFVNLIAPVVAGLAFTHFCLAELASYRRSAAQDWQPRVRV